MPVSIITSPATVPADVSTAIRDLTAACRAWPAPLNFHGGHDGGPVFLPGDAGHAVVMCRHILNPHQFDHWLYVLAAFALLGLVSIPMWLLWTYQFMRSCSRLVTRLANRSHRPFRQDRETTPKRD